MERLQKKCIVGSACLHGGLLCVVVFGAGFFTAKPEMVKYIELIPANAIITDGATRGGGNPNVSTPPAAGSPAAAMATPTPPAPKPPTPETTPEPSKPAPVRETPPPPKPTKQSKQKSADAVPVEKPKSKETVKRDLGLDKLFVRDAKKIAEEKVAAKRAVAARDAAATKAAQAQAARDRARAVESAVAGIAGGLSKGVGVEVPGPGGQAFINYRDLIASAYQRRYDQMLLTAGDIARGDTSVDVAITIARDGRVVESHIRRPSSNTALNKLVNRVLEGVTQIAPFPSGASDERRTFNLTFDLKAKQLAG